MVADVAPKIKRPRKLVPFRLPEPTRLSVRSLYVVQGLPPAQIALAVNLTPEQVRNLIAREKWTALRQKGENTRKRKIEALQDSRAREDINRVVEATAILSEDLSLRSLNRASECLDAKDDKGLQMVSGAALNFVKIARMSRGLDARAAGFQSGAQGNGGNSPTVIFIGDLERVAPKTEPRNVTPNGVESDSARQANGPADASVQTSASQSAPLEITASVSPPELKAPAQ